MKKKMKSSIAVTVLVVLVFVDMHLAVGSKQSDVRFKVRINERGARFVEKIIINENENTVTFMVPRHNDVEHSEVRNDFNLNLTITRLPALGVCYVNPLDKTLPHPSKMRSDMNYVRRMREQIQRPDTAVKRSSGWAVDKQLKDEYLHPSITRFCAGFPVYR